MKRILTLLILLALIYLAAGRQNLRAAYFTQPANVPKTAVPDQPPAPQAPTQGPTQQDRALAALLRQMTNRSTQGLIQEKHPKGGYQLNLKGRFQNVSLAKLGAQGKPVVGCIDSLDSANAFLGRNLETGQSLPTSARPDSESARLAGMSEGEYQFYQTLILEAAHQRKLAPNSATITIFNDDGIGEGFNDLTPKAAEGGNNGATLGAQRLNLFNQAAAIWGAFLDSSVPTVINAQFNPLAPCAESGVILGSTGAGFIHRDFPGAIFPGTWYHEALANKLSDEDRNTAPDIFALFNSDIDNGCLGSGTRFYYGFDNATPPGTINLLVVMLHEFAHGLGFSTFVDGSSGTLAAGFPDIYSRFMFDRDVNLHWHEMTDAQRQASALNTNDVLWDGPNVRIASGFLSAGRETATGRVELHMPNPLDNAASISHWSTAATPNLLMEPLITPGLPLNLDLTRQLLRDLGWYRDSNVDLIPDAILSVLPNTGSVTGGLPTNVSWTNFGGFNRNVTIELSTNGGLTFPITLAEDVANTGSRSVTIPNTPTTQARVRVREHNFVAPAETSADNFTILAGTNNIPTISAVAVNRQAGSPVTNDAIANVNDPDQTLNTLGVTVNGVASATVNGVTVSGISVNAAGVVSANVVASCTATTANFTLTVTDAVSATAQTTLTVTVTANTAPVLTYTNQSLLAGSTLNVTPDTGPSDNGSVSTIALLSQGTYTGTIGVNNSTGVVSISNAAPVGVHTLTIRATDNCGTVTEASFTLTVNNNLPQITAAAPLARTQGSAGTISQIATVSDVETAAGSLTVAATTVPAGLLVTGLTNTNGVVTASVAALCNATPGANTVVLTVTDGNNAMATANLTINVAVNTAPLLTYNNQSVGGNSGLTINPASGPSDNGMISSIVLQSQGTYTGTISVNNNTGVVTIGNATPIGTHTITIRATDDCLTTTDASFTLIVGNNAPSITAGGTFIRQQGSAAGAAVQVATVNDIETAPGSLTIAATTVPPGITVGSLTNTNGTITATLAADCTATPGNNLVTLTVTDANNGTATANFTVNVTANTPPVLTYTNQSVAAGGTLNVAATTGPSDNGTVNTIVVQSPGTYTGTLAVNASGQVSFSNAKPGGVHTITIRATDNCGAITDATFTLTVNCPAISVNPNTLPNGTLGTGYNQTVTASGGTAPYTFNVSAGTLPNGLTLSGGGVLSGPPGASGVFNFTVQATDANGCTGTRAYGVTINTLPTISAVAVSRQQGNPVVNATIANVNDADQALNTLTVTVDNGASATVNGVSVAGLSVNNAGVVTANVSADCTATTANFTLTVTDNASATATATLTVTVTVNSAPVLTYNNQTLSTGGTFNINPATGPSDNGTVASITLQSQGTYTGAISVDNSTGVVTLTNAKPTGTHTLTIRSTDNCGTTTDATFTLTLNCPTISLSPTTLPNGTAGTGYNQTLTGSGGTAPYVFSVTNLSVPGGMSLSSSGVLSGTPTGFGTFNFTVRATDANGCFGERPYTLTINPSCSTITVSPVTLANGFQGTTYSQTLTAAGGTAPHTFAVTAGSLPNGLTLASGGALTGVPTAAGTFGFTVTATDNNGCTGTRVYSVIISGTGLQFYALPSPVRLLDTRNGTSPNACSQPDAPIAGGSARNQLGRNFCGIPANAQALTGNITTVQSGGGFLTLYPSGTTQPTVASTNYGANEIVNNVFTVGLGASDGAFNIFAQMTTEVVVDVTGYYAPPAANGLYFHALPAPVRLLETRSGLPIGCVKPGTPLVGGTDSLQTATTPCTGIPATARSVVGNATTVSPQNTGYLTLYPADVANAPLVASSNYGPNQIVNGPFTVGLSASGQFKIFTTATTELVVDVLGYYSTEAVDVNGAGLLFTPLQHPVRLLETRNDAALPGCFKPNAPLNGNQVYTQAARGTCDSLTIPASALGVVGNATSVIPVGVGYLTLWPSTATQPTVATANFDASTIVNRHFIVGLGQADGAFKLFASVTTDLVLDLAGYFAP